MKNSYGKRKQECKYILAWHDYMHVFIQDENGKSLTFKNQFEYRASEHNQVFFLCPFSRIAVTDEQFEREKNYCAAISIAKSLLAKGLISERDYRKIDTIYIKKYRPILGGLKAKSP